jgi:hypothetical protein
MFQRKQNSFSYIASSYFPRASVASLGLLCVLLAHTAFADLRRDLPIGYQEITEVEKGKYRVLARCIETRKLLEAVAEKTGKPVVFDESCNTYVSILHPSKIASPESWMDYIATMSGSENCTLRDDGVWHVRSLSINPVFEPGLTEQEVIEKYRRDVPPRPNAPSGIEEGLVFYHGVLLPPPYDVAWRISDEGYAEVTINGVGIKKLSPKPPIGENRKIPEIPPSGQFEDRKQLRDYVVYRLYPDLLPSMSPDKAREAVISFLETQSLVESVVEDMDFRPNIAVRFKGENSMSVIFPVNYDFNLGNITRQPADNGPSLESAAASSATTLASQLTKEKISFYATTGTLSMIGDGSGLLVDTLKTARDLPLLQAECVLSEVVEDRVMARELAANLSGNFDAAISYIEAIRQRMKKELESR